MADNLRRRGMTSEDITDICFLCGKEGETIDHLFLHLVGLVFLPVWIWCFLMLSYFIGRHGDGSIFWVQFYGGLFLMSLRGWFGKRVMRCNWVPQDVKLCTALFLGSLLRIMIKISAPNELKNRFTWILYN